MPEVQKLLKITCPDCGRSFNVRPPAGAGLGKLRCPACGKTMIINFPPEACAPAPEPVRQPNRPTLHKLRRSDGGLLSGSTEIRLAEGSYTIGRTDPYTPSDIQIDDDSMVSRRSVVMTTIPVPGGFTHTLEVLAATNPVTVNNIPVRPGHPAIVGPGDTICLGMTALVIS